MDSVFSSETFVSDPICKEIPYFGLTRLASKAFALEQYGNSLGIGRFSEWFAKLASQGFCASGHVQQVDVVPDPESKDGLGETYGYEVMIHVAIAPAEELCITETMNMVGRIEGLTADVRDGILLEEFAKRRGFFSFASWFASACEANYFVGCDIDTRAVDAQKDQTSYVVKVKRRQFLWGANVQA